jgi:hypothetical protein
VERQEDLGVVRVDRGCNVDCKVDVGRLMELLGEQPSLTWLELDASEVHRDANCPQSKWPKPGGAVPVWRSTGTCREGPLRALPRCGPASL